ncbi:MAG TPA: hypothetical protein VLG13_03720 [Patescibacteria group bacterium]|nr:hypothetical protein [Patescibacteria group bacterium]
MATDLEIVPGGNDGPLDIAELYPVVEALGDERLSTVFRLRHGIDDGLTRSTTNIARVLNLRRQDVRVALQDAALFTEEITSGFFLEETEAYRQRYEETGYNWQRQHAERVGEKVMAAAARHENRHLAAQQKWDALNFDSYRSIRLGDAEGALYYGFSKEQIPDLRQKAEKFIASRITMPLKLFLELPVEPEGQWHRTNVNPEEYDEKMALLFERCGPLIVHAYRYVDYGTDDSHVPMIHLHVVGREQDGDRRYRFATVWFRYNHNPYAYWGNKRERSYAFYGKVHPDTNRSITDIQILTRIRRGQELLAKASNLLAKPTHILDL